MRRPRSRRDRRRLRVSEWVGDGGNAIMVSTTTGEILQVEYSVFA
jgi:hypothetical protein